MKKELIIPEESRAGYDAYHFAPAMKVGNTIWVSGLTGSGPGGEVGTLEQQLHIVFKKLENVLKSAGATLDDVVELLSFHVDIHIDAQTVFAVKDQYFKKDYPAWTAVGVVALAQPGLLVEFRAQAVIGCGS